MADVHVLVTSQDAGGGGDQFTLAFIGLRAYAGRGDTLTFTTNATTTNDEERRGLTRSLAMGLVPFLARTPAGQALRITMPRVEANAPGAQTMPAADPWKAWVFEIDLTGDISGEQNYRNREFDLELLRTVAQLEDSLLDAALERLIAAEIVRPAWLAVTGKAFSFRHALIQDAAYQSLLLARRKEYHAAIGKALTENFPDLAAAQPELVAHHLTAADQLDP